MAFSDMHELRANSLLGNHAQVLADASSFRGKKDDPEAALEREVTVYRAHIAMQQLDLVLSELVSKTAPPLLALRNVAAYLKAREQGRPVDEFVAAATKSLEGSPDVLTIQSAAAVLCAEDQPEAVLAVVHPRRGAVGYRELMMRAVEVDCLLRMDRPDLAELEYKAMVPQGEDTTLTVLTSAAIALARCNRDAATRALQAYGDLVEKHGMSPTLAVGIATSHMQLGEFEKADEVLSKVIGGAGRDPDVLTAASVCAAHRGKPADLVGRFHAQLKATGAHPYVKHMAALESRFDQAAERVAAQNPAS